MLEFDVTVPDQAEAVRRRARRAVGPGRRRAARHRLRAAVVPRRRRSSKRRGRTSRSRCTISAYSLKALADAVAPLDDRRRVDRRPRLRQQPPGLARVRLDGRGQGRARVDLALPGPRPRAEGHPRQPGRRRPDQDDRGQVDPRLRGVRGRLGRPGAARVGRERPRGGRPRRASRCCRTGSRRPPARSSTSTAASTPSAPDPPCSGVASLLPPHAGRPDAGASRAGTPGPASGYGSWGWRPRACRRPWRRPRP